MFFILPIILTGQEPAKRALSIDDFAGWKTISGEKISNNGEYVVYELNPQKGDGNLIIVDGNRTDTIPRGTEALISPGNDFVVFKIKQPEAVIRKAKLDNIKNEDSPKDSIGIFYFNRKSLFKFPDVKSYKIPEENASWVAFLAEETNILKDTIPDKPSILNKTKKQPGDNLVLLKILTADTLVFKDVTEYFYAKKGSSVFYIRQNEDSVKTFSTLSVFNTENGSVTDLFSSEGWIKKVVSDETGRKYSFLLSKDTTKEKDYALYFGEDQKEPAEIANKTTRGIPVGWSPSENGDIYFSKDGSKLFFGTAKTPVPEAKDTIPDDEKPQLDIWNWMDLKLQPQQKVEAEKEKKRTFLAVYHLAEKRLIQLANIQIKQVSTLMKGNSDIGLGTDDSPYLRALSWTGQESRDYYLVDFKTGIKRIILTDKSFVRISPQGKYIVWYEPADSSYYAKSTDINFVQPVSLTKIIPVAFYNEDNDRPAAPAPYGIAGWGQDDRFVYIYDRYDIWRIDPAGERVPVNMTKTFGRRNLTRLRYVKTDDEQEHIPLNEQVILSAIDERTMSQGYFSTQISLVKDPDLLVMDRVIFGNFRKAKNADRILYSKQNVSNFPDLWTNNSGFLHAKRISEANLGQTEFIWPDVELVRWTSFSGEELKGLLYKPENLDQNKKYPLIVYFYEKNSELLNRYQLPSPSQSTINTTFYASNGYLVFVPDITYIEGYPGQSAYNAIVSGTQFLLNTRKYVDGENMGLQGQSWGGYQTAYLITQTDMYKAAMAGAPVSNMTSAYGGIRWESGMSRMFQYEQTQSRIGGTLWEKPLNYIENSPLFYAPKINTPLLIMHNDNDGAVPWYQGIELFVALRRLDKPVWMLTYNGEPHNLKTESWANRMDLTIRMFQFFNFYLKSKPAPEWMEKGIPAVDKGKNLGY
jgi:dipeptidyl aminopeptidase/acylaminoacyl peptidase